MGEPTARFYTERQGQLCYFLIDLVIAAYKRKAALGLARLPAGNDYKIRAAVTETARADNAGLAEAARNATEAFAVMKAQGWIDDFTAARLAYKFAGEAMSTIDIEDILANAQPDPEDPPVPDDDLDPQKEAPRQKEAPQKQDKE
jgi:hypothetical protein